jgi:2-polyprenyl-3-methyl-5-hydroxy-6-metoxy-1,4-benzoquinol methylase
LFDGRRLERCPTCDLVFMAEPPTEAELAELNARYWTIAQTHSFLAERVHRAQMLARVEYLEQRLPSLRNSRVLDVGSGYGMLGRVLAARGHEVAYHAIESDPQCNERLRKNGAKSVSRRLEDSHEPDLDLVILSHVLEHVAEPRAFLGLVRGMLAPSGALFIEVPNQDFRHKQSMGTHLLFFSPKSLGLLLEGTGFTVEHLATVGPPLSALEAARAARSSSGRVGRIGAEMATRARLALSTRASLRERLQVAAYGEARQWIRCLARPDASAAR